MVRLMHLTIFEGVGLPFHREVYVCAELLDIMGRPIKNERAKTHVRFVVSGFVERNQDLSCELVVWACCVEKALVRAICGLLRCVRRVCACV